MPGRHILISLSLIAALAVGLAPRAGQAHPHVFVEVGLAFETDAQGRFTAVEVTWRYDALYSLLVLADRGMDMDADLRLTEAERAALLGFDLEAWTPEFGGALFVEAEGGAVALGAPEALEVRLDGEALLTRHRRALARPVAAPLTLRPYDPSYYAALSMGGVPALPEGCSAMVLPPESGAAEARLEALNAKGDDGVFEEVSLGIYFAETVEVSCPGS